jgi:hypothetical protein
MGGFCLYCSPSGVLRVVCVLVVLLSMERHGRTWPCRNWFNIIIIIISPWAARTSSHQLKTTFTAASRRMLIPMHSVKLLISRRADRHWPRARRLSLKAATSREVQVHDVARESEQDLKVVPTIVHEYKHATRFPKTVATKVPTGWCSVS